MRQGWSLSLKGLLLPKFVVVNGHLTRLQVIDLRQKIAKGMSVGGFDGLVPHEMVDVEKYYHGTFSGEALWRFWLERKINQWNETAWRPKIRLRPSQTYLYQ